VSRLNVAELLSHVELNDENLLTGEKTSHIDVKGWRSSERKAMHNRGMFRIGKRFHLRRQKNRHRCTRSSIGEGNLNPLEIEEKLVHENEDSLFEVDNVHWLMSLNEIRILKQSRHARLDSKWAHRAVGC
jgi:hypothetical protein